MSEAVSLTFTFVKDGVFYFTRRVPHELKRHFTSLRVAYSLRARSAKVAEARARRAADQLEDYWYHLRTRDAELPGKHMLRLQPDARAGFAEQPAPVASSSVLLSEAMAISLRLKGQNRPVTFHRAAERACGYAIDACGDKHLELYGAHSFPVGNRFTILLRGRVAASFRAGEKCLDALKALTAGAWLHAEMA